MKKLALYEPAMCCETGLCGVGTDPELLRVTTMIASLKKKSISIARYNLNSAPEAFLHPVVSAYLMQHGVDALPIALLDDNIVIEHRYPSMEEVSSLLGLASEEVQEPVVGGVFSQIAPCACSQGIEEKSGCCKDDTHE